MPLDRRDGQDDGGAGLGLAFLPHLAVAPEIRPRILGEVEVVDAEPLSRSRDLIHPRHRPLSVDAVAFLEALRAAVREVSGGPGGPGRRRRARRAPAP